MSTQSVIAKGNGNDMSSEGSRVITNSDNGDESLGKKIREIRGLKGWTLKQIAEISNLNINTLSLIENGKNSPSISTLQRLACAMDVPIKEFFEPVEPITPVVFTKHNERPQATSEKSIINNLGKGLTSSTLEPFILTMEKHATSGGRALLHSGYEFVFCLSGKILYYIREEEFELSPGDSILFSAQLSHHWENINDGESQLLLVMTPACGFIEQSKKHFYNFEGK
ncbi:MAG TPA: cupin [Rikenellaceae bacterium]|nr:cupin [Rikenellaceae bacterium]HCS40487.1 cupin [Anaerolineaceae bacterium]